MTYYRPLFQIFFFGGGTCPPWIYAPVYHLHRAKTIAERYRRVTSFGLRTIVGNSFACGGNVRFQSDDVYVCITAFIIVVQSVVGTTMKPNIRPLPRRYPTTE